MEADRLHQELGWASLLDYARDVLELTDRQARDLVQIGRSLPRLPELDRAFADGRLPWTKARELLRVVTPDTEGAWVARACEVSSRVLERQVSGALTGDLPPTHVGDEKGPERVRLVFQASSADAQVVRDALAYLRAATGVKREDVDDGALLASLCRRAIEAAADDEVEVPGTERYRVVVEHCPECRATTGTDAELEDTVVAEAVCDAEVVEMREGPTRGNQTHTVPPAKRRAVLHRDRHRCRVPGCSNRVYVDVHHVKARACGGGHAEGNLCTLCTVHHRMVHEGRLGIEVRGDEFVFSFADGRGVAVGLDPRVPHGRTGWRVPAAQGLGTLPAPRTMGTGGARASPG